MRSIQQLGPDGPLFRVPPGPGRSLTGSCLSGDFGQDQIPAPELPRRTRPGTPFGTLTANSSRSSCPSLQRIGARFPPPPLSSPPTPPAQPTPMPTGKPAGRFGPGGGASVKRKSPLRSGWKTQLSDKTQAIVSAAAVSIRFSSPDLRDLLPELRGGRCVH